MYARSGCSSSSSRFLLAGAGPIGVLLSPQIGYALVGERRSNGLRAPEHDLVAQATTCGGPPRVASVGASPRGPNLSAALTRFPADEQPSVVAADDEDGDGAVRRHVRGDRAEERAPETAEAPGPHDKQVVLP